MRSIKLLFFSFIITCLLSCVKEINIELDNSSNKLVIYTIAEVNKPIQLNVSHSIKIKDTIATQIFSGTLSLYENSKLVESLNFKNQNQISFKTLAKVNNHYKVTCSILGYPEVEDNFLVPSFPIIHRIDTSIIKRGDNYLINIKLILSDKNSDIQYYKLNLKEKRFIAYKKNFELSKIYFQSNSNISYYEWPADKKYYLFDEPKGIIENKSLKKNGFITANEIYFSNELKNKDKIELNLIIDIISNDIVLNYSTSQLIIEVSSINKEYFFGVYSYARINTIQNLDLPSSEEILTYSSVRNGYGFGASISTISDSTISSQKYKDFINEN